MKTKKGITDLDNLLKTLSVEESEKWIRVLSKVKDLIPDVQYIDTDITTIIDITENDILMKKRLLKIKKIKK